MPLDSAALAWFRRDLRAHDAAALQAALTAHGAVHCVFVFDTEILDALPGRADRRVDFIWRSVAELKAALERLGGGLHVLHKRAREEIPRLAANNGGWQCAASTGCDAQPWFRIFNPVTQSKKFDPRGAFIRKYLPELSALSDEELHAPRAPVVEHAAARARTLARYGAVRAAS